METIGFEEKLWQAADKLRGSMDKNRVVIVYILHIFLSIIFNFFNGL